MLMSDDGDWINGQVFSADAASRCGDRHGSADYTPRTARDRRRSPMFMYRWCRAIDRLDADAIRGVLPSRRDR